MSGTIQVRGATRADVPALRSMLARSFADDPIAAYLFPLARRREAGLRAFFGMRIGRALLTGCHVLTTDDNSGAALWVPPGTPAPGTVRSLLGVLPLVPFVAGRRLVRSLRILAEAGDARPFEPHWFLETLGTDPGRQRRGIGSSLVVPMLRLADSQRVRTYLESSKEENIAFYRRHGFEVTGRVLLDDGPVVWTMWRDPRPPAEP